MRRRSARISKFQAGLAAVVVAVTGTYFGFAKDIPFTRGYEIKAAFRTSNNLKPGSPVRIAGVKIGEVANVERAPDADAAVVTMLIEDAGRPLHRDAEMKIRPRIFLEGNFFVDVRPGRPGAGELRSGETIPVTQTATPVQLDQILTALQTDPREDLQALIEGYGDAIGGRPTAEEDADADPEARGETAGESLNDAVDHGRDALRGTAQVNEALRGSELHDLSRLIDSQRRIFATLSSREGQLQELITTFNRTIRALAAEQGSLRATVRALPGVLRRAGPALDALNSSFPATRDFARDILPGVRATPAFIRAATPWIVQTRRLVSRQELGGLARDLRPAAADLARVTDETVALLPQVHLLSRCALEVVLPTGEVKIEDGPFSTGLENYKEFFQALVGLSSESSNFDGNGQYTRLQPSGGDSVVSTRDTGAGRPLYARAPRPVIGSRPKRAARQPPFRTDVACHRNERPDLSSAKTGEGP